MPTGNDPGPTLSPDVFVQLVEAAPDAVVVINGTGTILVVNAQTEQLFGYRREEMLGGSIEMLLPERFREAHARHRARYAAEPAVRPMGEGFTLFGRRADGSEFHLDSSLSPLYAEGGILYVAAIRDVTERVHGAEALAESEERFRTLFEESPVGAAVIGRDLRFQDANQALCAMVGYSVDELRTMTFTDITHPDDIDVDVKLARQLFAGEIPGYALEKRYITRDSGVVWAQLTATMVRAPDESIRYGIGIMVDITERRKLETIRDEFIANAAHELRTPLATLVGLSETLATHMPTMTESQVTEAIAALRRQGARASALVSNLLDLTMLETGHLRVDLRPVDIRETIAATIEAAPPPNEKSLHIDVPEEAIVIADPFRLEQILMNLLTNAYRYGGRRVWITGAMRNAMFELSVADDGPGVPSSLIEKMFEPFTRGRTAGAVGGSGIGLALCRRLARALGGRLRYEPNEPSGARFVLTLESA